MKTLLLTGATGDIGAAIAEKFQNENYRVISPGRAELDLQTDASIGKFMSTINVTVDAYVHCAGLNDPKLLADLTSVDLQKTFQVNTFSFYSICQHLLKNFTQGQAASIVAISSLYGDISRKGRLAYSSSKHALNGMVKTLALELGAHQIKVNGVAPGFVDTKLTRKNNTDEVIASFKKKIPLARLATTDDIANVVYFLCSPLNSYINGQCIIVDGGYSVGGFQE